jgi:DNA-binding transcriptional regulator/RsmH inhibitor MraZ
MFGEKDIIGNEVLKIDNKKRVVLPKFTYAEENDELIVVKLNNHISIHTICSFEKRMQKLREEYKSLDSIAKKRLLQIKRILCSELSNMVKCEKNGRINLNGVVDEEKEIICIGCKDHVKLKIK